MTILTKLPQWQALQAHYNTIAHVHMRNLFNEDPHRFEQFSLAVAGLFLDYSKNRINTHTLKLLFELAKACEVPQQIDALFRGDYFNQTENYYISHPWLRACVTMDTALAKERGLFIESTLAKLRDTSELIRQGKQYGYSGKIITDVVNIGVGGSDLGAAFVIDALNNLVTPTVNFHFLADIDSVVVNNLLEKLSLETTLFIISSKSFTTAETLLNATTIKNYFPSAVDAAANFFAITAYPERAIAWGVRPQNILLIGDWINGRYSLWSAIGLPIAIAIGFDNFIALLQGACEMDQHFSKAPLTKNMPVILALLSVWYTNFFHAQSQAVIPYNYQLRRLPAYLQQMHMESYGKSVQVDGTPVNYATGPLIWGELGCHSQHAFLQLLHQGTHLVPADFIIATQSSVNLPQHQQLSFTNCLSQSRALMLGKSIEEVITDLELQGMSVTEAQQLAPHKMIPGNQPSNTLLFQRLEPQTLGALLALYEHKIFVQSVIWRINPFDQWGVELNKKMAEEMLPAVVSECADVKEDSSTQGLITLFHKHSMSALNQPIKDDHHGKAHQK